MLPSEGGVGNNTKYEKGYLMAWWTEKAMIEKNESDCFKWWEKE